MEAVAFLLLLKVFCLLFIYAQRNIYNYRKNAKRNSEKKRDMKTKCRTFTLLD